MQPTSATLRTYQVGFGDCFLLSFEYPNGDERHILIDFGSTALPPKTPRDQLLRVAQDIKARCRGKLHVVVATHRHRDHISGFSTNGHGTGNIIKALRPDVIIQPWTEDPAIPIDAQFSPRANNPLHAFLGRLAAMHEISAFALAEARRGTHFSKTVREQLAFLGEDNLKNVSSVKNLQAMGRGGKAVYAKYGTTVHALKAILPGVSVRVLGPPDLTQSTAIQKQRTRDPDEFWHLVAMGLRAANGGRIPRGLRGRPLARVPSQAQWFRKRIETACGDQLLELVRELDHQMNNTSLILLFQAGTKKLLFPGDAQIENWSYALEDCPESTANRKLLADVDLYKVGHHGSLNATPKTLLWQNFNKRGPSSKPDRLHTVVSTLLGKHGSTDRETEVPRRPLVAALKAETEYLTSQSIPPKSKLYEDLKISLT